MLARGIPGPRRALLICGSAAAIFLMLSLFAPATLPPVLTPHAAHHEPDSPLWSSSKWIPPIFNPDRPDRPSGFDEDGQCMFLSPFAALSAKERARAEALVLEEDSHGIVRASASSSDGGDSKHKGRSHPILRLLRDGEQKFHELMSGQSLSLEQAVNKYEAKWGRPPPKGFDDWYLFARDRDALLIDEFDAIMESLLPFYGLPVDVLKQRGIDAEGIVETFTLIVHDGKVELQWNDNYSRDKWWSTRPRADAQINLMEPFLEHLPAFHATFTIHDAPSILLDYKRNEALVNAAVEHKVVVGGEEKDRLDQNWHAACPPTSPLNRGIKEPPAADSFISRHIDSMNPCDHPGLMEGHGMFLEKHTKATQPQPHTKLYPILVPSKTLLNGDIPITPVSGDGRRDAVGNDPAWKNKKGKLYWRGRTTGLEHNKGNGAKWRQSHRERLHWLANHHGDNVTQVLTASNSSGTAGLIEYSLRELGQYYMDAKLINGPWQCDGSDGTCDEMKAEIDFGGEGPVEESNQFKYLLDIDGNGWSSRFPRLMASLNVVIKATIFPEWNSHHLFEWFAYVPTKVDYSDLYSILAFFRGTPQGRGGHDEVARRIALNGQCWVERTLRREDLQIYMFRLYLEYARLMSPDRDNGKMDFVLQDYHRDPAAAGVAIDAADEVKDIEAIPGIDQ